MKKLTFAILLSAVFSPQYGEAKLSCYRLMELSQPTTNNWIGAQNFSTNNKFAVSENKAPIESWLREIYSRLTRRKSIKIDENSFFQLVDKRVELVDVEAFADVMIEGYAQPGINSLQPADR